MTPEKLKEDILEELNAKRLINSHGITKDNIDQLLVEPKLVELLTFEGQKKNYWLVLDEMPADIKNGYLIVYDEREDMFGLATKTMIGNNDIGYLVGLYGSFVEVLNNM